MDDSILNTLLIIAITITIIVYGIMIFRKFSVSYDRPSIMKIFPALVAMIAGTISILFFFVERRVEPTSVDIAPTSITSKKSLDDLSKRIKEIEEKQLLLETKSNTLSPNTNASQQDVIKFAKIKKIEDNIKKNTEAIRNFEGQFLTDAERLITLPLLKRDFDAVKQDIATVKENISGLWTMLTETNSQNRWVIGTLALGVLALVLPAVKSLLSPSQKVKKPNEESAKT